MEAYEKRMIKEFNDLNKRMKKLEKLLRKIRAGKIDFDPTCPEYMLHKQYKAMREYSDCLKDRAILEDIDLEY